MDQSVVPGARFVDPTVLARIGNLELVARAVVDGFINGMHRSPYFGASVDFAEHRGYVPGDDIRRVDWRLYARTDRYYIKEYEADTNSNFSVLLDVSKSMGFGSGGVTKLDYGKMLAGCLTYLVHRQRDRVGFVAFDSDIVEHVPPSAKHMDMVLHVLDRAQADRAGQPAGAAAQDGRALRAPRPARPDLGSLRGARRRARGDRPAALPRQRHRSSSTCSTRRSSISRSAIRRRSRTWRAASRSRSCPTRSPINTRSWCRLTSTRFASGFRRTASTTRC